MTNWNQAIQTMYHNDTFTSDLVAKAIPFARAAHEASGQHGYFDDHVMKVYIKVCSFENISLPVKVAAILHDVYEDCKDHVTKEMIRNMFGDPVWDLVWRLSDEDGKNRKERKMKTYWKVRERGDAVLIKLADRWENVTRSINTKSKHGDMYAKEYYTFKCALWRPDEILEPLWMELDELHAKLKEKNNWLQTS